MTPPSIILQPGNTVGIDLGTAFSALGRLDPDGNPIIYTNKYGSLITPSVVVLGKGRKIVIGNTHHPDATDDDRVVTAIKRKMGHPNYYLMHEGRRLNPEFLSAMILRRLIVDAERQIGPIGNAVITVPYYFNDPCRRATRNAGRIGGVNVIDLLNEPTAATLAYAWIKGQLGETNAEFDEKRILVYDLGGGTFDVTVVKYTPTEFRVLATDGDTLLGGMDWTKRIVDHVAERFQQKHGFDPRENEHATQDLVERCDYAKMELSQRPQTLVQVSAGKKNLMVSLNRQEFEGMTADLLQRTLDTTELVLDQCGVHPSSLDEILLVGGSTYMPGVTGMLTELCGREPLRILEPQLAVAQGAAIHAAILEVQATNGKSEISQSILKRLQSVQTHDVNAHSLGVELTDSGSPGGVRNHIMIPRNQPLPFLYQQRFVTTRSNPEGIRIRLLEGESTDLSGCTFIGEVRIVGLPPNLPEGSPVEVTYAYDENRRILVTAQELTGNRMASVEITHQGALDSNTMQNFQNLAVNYAAQ